MLEYNDGKLSGKWRGAVGIVCRIYFPRIDVQYALKIFRTIPDGDFDHGPHWEIPTAFSAAHAEPYNNTRVYMASVLGRGYMLSRWQNASECDGAKFCKHNENKIFYTKSAEHSPRNYIAGCRIDYGQTYQTAYGALPYPLRKLYRRVKYAAMRGDVNEIKSMFTTAKCAAALRDINRVMNILSTDAYRDNKKQLQNIINRDWTR